MKSITLMICMAFFFLVFNLFTITAQAEEKRGIPAIPEESLEEALDGFNHEQTDDLDPLEKDHSGIENILPTIAGACWIGCNGSFNMTGNQGGGIFIFNRKYQNRIFRFVDSYPIGGTPGWTYKADGTSWYFFFAQRSGGRCNSNRWLVAYSFNNSNFYRYDCTR